MTLVPRGLGLERASRRPSTVTCGGTEPRGLWARQTPTDLAIIRLPGQEAAAGTRVPHAHLAQGEAWGGGALPGASCFPDAPPPWAGLISACTWGRGRGGPGAHVLTNRQSLAVVSHHTGAGMNPTSIVLIKTG